MINFGISYVQSAQAHPIRFSYIFNLRYLNAKCIGQAYNVCGSENMTWNQYLEQIAAVVGGTYDPVYIPTEVLKVVTPKWRDPTRVIRMVCPSCFSRTVDSTTCADVVPGAKGCAGYQQPVGASKHLTEAIAPQGQKRGPAREPIDQAEKRPHDQHPVV